MVASLHIQKNFAVAVCWAVLWGWLATTALGQHNYEIRKVSFKGSKTFDKSTLLEKTSVYESTRFSRWILKKEPSLFNPEFADADADRVRRFYQSEGFLHAEVKLDSVRRHEKRQRVDLFFSVKENAPVLVDKLLFQIDSGQVVALGDSALRRVMRRPLLAPDTRFVDQSLRNDMENINDRFRNRGYMYVETHFDLKLDTDSNKTDVTYRIFPGTVCSFGATAVSGNRYVRESVIRRELAYAEGQQFSKRKLETTRHQLYNLQLFRIVSLNPQSDRVTMLTPIPVKVFIQEMPRWSTKFGAGYGTEDQVRAFGDFTYRGLWGGPSRLNLYLKYSALTPYYVSLSWVNPQFVMPRLSLAVNPYAKQENEPGYTTRTYGVNFPASYVWSAKLRGTLTYYAEKVTQMVESDDADVPNPEDEDFLYNKSGVSATLGFSNARPVVSPVRGWTFNLGAKVNGGPFGSDFDYTRLWADVRTYQKAGRFTFAERAMVGAIRSADAAGFVPVEDRWYSGGSNSNRGWARSAIGPRRDSGTPLGGKSILEANAEVRHPLFWQVALAAFVDASNVWPDTYRYRPDELNIAAGGGLRINTPIGPVRLDVGVPVWNAKRSAQFFLSVGQAF